MIAFLATDCPLLSGPAPYVRRYGRVDPHALTEDLLQVGQLSDGVVGSPGLQGGQLAVYLPLELLLDLGVGGQQVGGEQQGGSRGLVTETASFRGSNISPSYPARMKMNS